jgi:hypothetical protein
LRASGATFFTWTAGAAQLCRFPDYVEEIFQSVQNGTVEYPNFFTAHSLSFASEGKGRAKNTMDHYLAHMKAGMAKSLQNDPKVRKDAFSEDFTASDFLEFVLTSLIALLFRQKKDCSVLLEVVERTIY